MKNPNLKKRRADARAFIAALQLKPNSRAKFFVESGTGSVAAMRGSSRKIHIRAGSANPQSA